MKLGKLTVGVLWKPLPNCENIYIGRKNKSLKASPLACPYTIDADHTRDAVISAYEMYLTNELNKGNAVILHEMERISLLLTKGINVNLQCYCVSKGLKCHGEIIKEIIDDYLLEYTVQQEK